MNICVCVKQVEEIYAQTGMNPARYFLDPVDRIFRVNPYDEAAMVLAQKAAGGREDARIILLTMGPLKAEDELWRIMAMGGDQLCHIELTRPEDGDYLLDSWGKAQVLADAVNTLNSDLVLCGKESSDRQNGLVAPFMAHHLKRPFVAAITDLQLKKDTAEARITQNAGRGIREVIDCRLPAVFSVDLSAGAPKMPSYLARQKARKQEITRLVFDNQALTAKTRRIDLSAPRPRPKPVPAPDSRLPSFERVCQLLSGSSAQKKGRIVTGSVETQVEEIIRFLSEHDIMPVDP